MRTQLWLKKLKPRGPQLRFVFLPMGFRGNLCWAIHRGFPLVWWLRHLARAIEKKSQSSWRTPRDEAEVDADSNRETQRTERQGRNQGGNEMSEELEHMQPALAQPAYPLVWTVASRSELWTNTFPGHNRTQTAPYSLVSTTVVRCCLCYHCKVKIALLTGSWSLPTPETLASKGIDVSHFSVGNWTSLCKYCGGVLESTEVIVSDLTNKVTKTHHPWAGFTPAKKDESERPAHRRVSWDALNLIWSSRIQSLQLSKAFPSKINSER